MVEEKSCVVSRGTANPSARVSLILGLVRQVLTTEELRVREQLDEVRPIFRLDVIALQVQRDIFESRGIAIDVERPHTISPLIRSQLFFEEL